MAVPPLEQEVRIAYGLECDDLKCEVGSHKEELDKYILDIIEAIERTTEKTILYRNVPKAKSKYKARCRKHIN